MLFLVLEIVYRDISLKKKKTNILILSHIEIIQFFPKVVNIPNFQISSFPLPQIIQISSPICRKFQIHDTNSNGTITMNHESHKMN